MIDNGWKKINIHLRSRMQRSKIDIKYSPRQSAHIPAVRVPARFVQQPTNHVVLSKSKKHSSHSQSMPAFNPRTTNKKNETHGSIIVRPLRPILIIHVQSVLEERPEVFQRLARGGLQVPEEAGRESGVVQVNFFLYKKIHG
jgi:hypothetical protein